MSNIRLIDSIHSNLAKAGWSPYSIEIIAGVILLSVLIMLVILSFYPKSEHSNTTPTQGKALKGTDNIEKPNKDNPHG